MKQCRFTSVMIECLIFVRECILHTTDFISNSQNNLTREYYYPHFQTRSLRLREVTGQVVGAGLHTALCSCLYLFTYYQYHIVIVEVILAEVEQFKNISLQDH